jgi:hypothetical protein
VTGPQEFTLPPIRRNLNGSRKKPSVERKLRIRPMNPVAMCGKDTSVTELYRVEEMNDRGRVHHLVFFDRHGWYCEHGKQCSVVKDVQKFTRSKL